MILLTLLPSQPCVISYADTGAYMQNIYIFIYEGSAQNELTLFVTQVSKSKVSRTLRTFLEDS